MAEGQQPQERNPAQNLALALDRVRRVQNMLELNAPGQSDAINMMREAGDLIWIEIQRIQQQQQQQQQQQGS